MDIEKLNQSLPKRFKLKKSNNINSEDAIIYLDNNVLGRDYKEKYGYTTIPHGIKKGQIESYCHLSEINYLHVSDLPDKVEFNFRDMIDTKIDDSESKISSEFSLVSIMKEKEILSIEFFFCLDIFKYKGQNNPIKFINEFYNYIKALNNCVDDWNEVMEDAKMFGFYYQYKVQNNTSKLSEITNKVVKDILNKYDELEKDISGNVFESIFNFPKEYQSILKPYLLYFEEFLNDLCIKTDVNIQVVGEETILSVVPKDKDEALDKIADALKAYLCAPVMSNGVSMEESLQMQTTVTKLYAQCKHLESQMMFKELSLKEQNKQIELKDNIINESKRVLLDAGVESNIVTQDNTIFLESLKSLKIDGTKIEKKTFLSSIKGSLKFMDYFNLSFDLKRKEFDKENK